LGLAGWDRRGGAAVLTPYPQIVEYNEAVQHPQTAFRDPELRQGRVKLNALGLPVALAGGFALTYRMTTPRRQLALRCFHRDILAGEHKYAAIARTLSSLNSRYFVGFEYLPDGIRIRGGFYPVLKMDWAEGEPLGVWLDRNSGDRRAVATMRRELAALAAFLEGEGIAHGDIQTGNVMVSRNGLKLVDYDGMYVPGMPADYGCESGHKHFQHPRRSAAGFGPTIDHFSFIAVDLSLAALIEEPGLYRRYCQGGETILFRAADFAEPDRSEVFRRLAQFPALRRPIEHFAAVCRGDVAAVPTLAEFQAGRGIATRAAAPLSVAAPAAARAGSNRTLLARLLPSGAAPPPLRAAAALAPAPPPAQPARNNRAIVQGLRSSPAQQPVRPPSAAGASPSKPIPRTGSFVIHPRTAPPLGSPPAEPSLVDEAPGLWQRVRRLLGIV
jgi:hypothetical protein